jgi:uncharacterized protein
MIPDFPKFKKLQLEDRIFIEQKTANFDPFSDYNFASMYGYNTHGLHELSILNDNLVVVFSDYITNEPFYSYFGKNKPSETVRLLLDTAKKKKFLPILKLVPEICITEELRNDKTVTIVEDRDNFDYILSTHDIVNMHNKHYNKRKQFQIFEREHPERVVEELNLQSEDSVNQIMEVFDKWRHHRGKTEKETDTERVAILRTLENFRKLHGFGISISLDHKMIGFAISDFRHHEFAEFHFAKATADYRGIMAALYTHLAHHLYKKGFKYMNIEQDLGIVGLRSAKEQWHPVRFLKKYVIGSK